MATDWSIVTYGGIEILGNVFRSISLIFYGEGRSILHGAFVLTASVSTLFIFGQAALRNSIETIFSKYFISYLVFAHVLLLPKMTIHIEDKMSWKSTDPTVKVSDTIEDIPFLLGVIAVFTSNIGYILTDKIEKVMHVPDSIAYNKTGNIFGAESLMEANKYEITDATLATNFRSFVKQCVFHDLHQGRYSLEEMKTSPNLWKLFENKTSNVLGIMYVQPQNPIVGEGSSKAGQGSANTGGEESETSSSLLNPTPGKCSFYSCKNAVKAMKPYFEAEKNYHLRDGVLGRLPLSFQALTNLQKDANELISQQLVINAMTENPYGDRTNFAVSRAYSQQKETYQVLGALAAKSLVTIRNVLEALIYASFIFAACMVFVPGGLRTFSTWVQLAGWIQLWPPMFAILNFIMQIVAQSRARDLFGASPDFNFFTSIGMRNLHGDMYALAGYLALSVPFISYAILKGGVGSFIHLASSMMGPAQSAASSAAHEATTGNYSFGNVSYDTTNAHNLSAFKHNSAPTHASGFMTLESGSGTLTQNLDSGEAFYRQNTSQLRTHLSGNETFSSSLQQAHREAKSHLDTESTAYTDSMSRYASQAAGFVEHMSRSAQMNQSTSDASTLTEQNSAQQIYNMAEQFGHKYGLDARRSLELLGSANASVGGASPIGASLGGKYAQSGSTQEVWDAARQTVQSDQFQKYWNDSVNLTETAQSGHLSDEGIRLHQDMNRSFQDLETSARNFQAAESNVNELSHALSYSDSSSFSVQQNLDHAFFQYASSQLGGTEAAQAVMDLPDNSPEKAELIQSFAADWKTWSPTLHAGKGEGFSLSEPAVTGALSQSMSEGYHTSTQKMPHVSADKYQSDLADFTHQKSTEMAMDRGDIARGADSLAEHVTQSGRGIRGSIQGSQNPITAEQAHMSDAVSSEGDKWLISRAWKGASKPDFVRVHQGREYPHLRTPVEEGESATEGEAP